MPDLSPIFPGGSLTTKDPLTVPRGASRIDPEVSPLSFSPVYLRAVSGPAGRCCRPLLPRQCYVMGIPNGILWHQKTRSRDSKCTISIRPTLTSQIIHLLVLTTSSVVNPSGEARSAIFEEVGHSEAKL